MRKRLHSWLARNRDFASLLAAFVLLAIAGLQPTIPIKRPVHTYLLVIDITQSMNTQDMVLYEAKASRLAYTRQLAREAVAKMPCGSRVSVALFAGVVVHKLFNPIEVCSGFAIIQDTLNHLDWRHAWHGNSRIAFGLLNAADVLKGLKEPASLVFFTDGEETPKLHAFNQADFSQWQARGWLLVGIGGSKPTPVPKYDEHNQLIGYWANDSNQLIPGIVQVSEETRLSRGNNVAMAEHDKLLSTLDEKYLVGMADTIHGTYVRGDSAAQLSRLMQSRFGGQLKTVHVDISWMLAALAAGLLLVPYVNNQISYLRKVMLDRSREGEMKLLRIALGVCQESNVFRSGRAI